MRETMVLIIWAGRMALELAEITCRAKRALDAVLDNNNPWRRSAPWWERGNQQPPFWGRGG